MVGREGAGEVEGARGISEGEAGSVFVRHWSLPQEAFLKGHRDSGRSEDWAASDMLPSLLHSGFAVNATLCAVNSSSFF